MIGNREGVTGDSPLIRRLDGDNCRRAGGSCGVRWSHFIVERLGEDYLAGGGIHADFFGGAAAGIGADSVGGPFGGSPVTGGLSAVGGSQAARMTAAPRAAAAVTAVNTFKRLRGLGLSFPDKGAGIDTRPLPGGQYRHRRRDSQPSASKIFRQGPNPTASSDDDVSVG